MIERKIIYWKLQGDVMGFLWWFWVPKGRSFKGMKNRKWKVDLTRHNTFIKNDEIMTRENHSPFKKERIKMIKKGYSPITRLEWNQFFKNSIWDGCKMISYCQNSYLIRYMFIFPYHEKLNIYNKLDKSS